MRHRERPGEARAPIVADDARALFSERPDQPSDVFNEDIDAVRAHARWFARQVVATAVGRDDPIPEPHELGDDVAKRKPELRKSVNENDQRARARGHIVKSNTFRDFSAGVLNIGSH
jgi:hypothetical protein